ncbi:ABC transporter permease [Nocardioides eburneiflavus]|uniref:ABC transporter permease n=1 Tax=Nocardioides eburneiflavus TaxID=2518372 RepID=A0A4Z1CGM4_9ACTN|nr:ABC transporter permease [Nocardioides eburneiflavus]TGN65058.1 ABC transporter permease [Nocardioides eburneiflavus]
MTGRSVSLGRALLIAYSVLVGMVLVLPTFVVVPVSFSDQKSLRLPKGFSTQWYENFFTDPGWYESAILSLRVGLVVTVIATVLGTAAALGLNKALGAWKGAARAWLLAPIIVPGVITAIGIFYVFLKLGLTQNYWGFVIAHTVMAIPFVIVTVTASLSGFDHQLVKAAQSLGARPWSAFRQVMLPLIAPGVITGALFAFLTSFDEAIITLFLSGPFTRTLPVKIYQSVTQEFDPTVAAASTLLLVVTTLLMILIGVLSAMRERR